MTIFLIIILCIVVFILFTILYTNIFIKPLSDIIHFVSNKIILSYPSYTPKIKRLYRKLKSHINVELHKDKTFRKLTVIYVSNNSKLIYPDNKHISASKILRFFNIK